ncbi:hypothetical protein CKAH01_08534 [Colletotrichum kahawae]|uniref:Uncharacterized protein n=1 Tax=Colletotrichum kahawae TaxID=34407 RepID=A0AAE0CZL1_COLKA|nr:hypothetical protein CKAH01_08534 [Colletotrichum kahawae]
MLRRLQKLLCSRTITQYSTSTRTHI